MRITEEQTDRDKRDILELESEIIELKIRMIDASKDDKEKITLDIDDLKQEIADIKERGTNEDA